MAKNDQTQSDNTEQAQTDEQIQDEATAQAAEAAESAVDSAAQSAEGAPQGGDAELSVEETLARMEEEVAQAKDAVLRAQAEAQNASRRAEQDVEKARKFALERFAAELLPVIDNLERALETTAGGDEKVKPIAEGVELTLKSFLDVMAKFNVVTVDPQGEPFDPNLHQAMSMVENPDVEPNSVIAVMQKGYTLNGRLVRPAMVMVSK